MFYSKGPYWLHRETPHSPLFKFDPKEANSSKVNKMLILKKKIEGHCSRDQLSLTRKYQKYFVIVKHGEL
jgi:hypothetical protein